MILPYTMFGGMSLKFNQNTVNTEIVITRWSLFYLCKRNKFKIAGKWYYCSIVKILFVITGAVQSYRKEGLIVGNELDSMCGISDEELTELFKVPQ